jgi:CMD domain protein
MNDTPAPPADQPGDLTGLTNLTDLTDRLAGLAPNSPLQLLRQQRAKVAAATQGSYDALFDPALPDLSLVERLLVALHAGQLSRSPALVAHYRRQLETAAADPSLVAAVSGLAHARPGAPAAPPVDPRLGAMLAFTRLLIERPIAADKAALQTLSTVGLATPAAVALAQLIAFLSYQVRLLAGLEAMRHEGRRQEGREQASTTVLAPSPAAPAGGAPHPVAPHPAAPAAAAPSGTTAAPGAIIRAHGFSNESFDWRAWLDVVALQDATAEQVQVLEESHPKAKVSDYYLLLVHQPEILRQRSSAFNAIMYAPRGLSRAERELGATVTSRINGCVYCASVHAQRFEQMARRNDVIRGVFDDPQTAGSNARERAIVQFSIALTQRPDELAATDVEALAAAGLEPLEILDLIHSVAIFAWANRLMLNLGEPVPAQSAVSA